MGILPAPRPFWTARRRAAVERQARQLVRCGQLDAATQLLLDAELSEREQPTVVDVAAAALAGDDW